MTASTRVQIRYVTQDQLDAIDAPLQQLPIHDGGHVVGTALSKFKDGVLSIYVAGMTIGNPDRTITDVT